MYRNKFQSKPRNLTEVQPQRDAGYPADSRVGKESTILMSKTIKGLPKPGSSLTVKADPYALTLPSSDPYALLNSPNAKAGGNYGGADNLDGGVTNQLITSELSNFLHCFDSMLLRCRVNYRYLPVLSSDVNRGKGFVREMMQSIDEIISIAKSTTYTQLAVNTYYIQTDMPMIVDDELVSDYSVKHSCGDSAGLYALLICYQTYLQAFAQVFNAYNKFRANQGLMLNMSWNRETPRLNSYFSLMNKNSMVGQFKSLAFVLNGEYFDQEWMRQFNLIGSLVSRKSNAMVDPLQEVTCTHNLPKFKLTTSANVTIFDSESLDLLVSTNTNPDIAKWDTFAALMDSFSYELSVNKTLYYVRNDAVYIANSETGRFNFISDCVGLLTTVAGVFKPAMGDLRTMLDVVQRVGANAWVKSTQLEVFNNLNSSVVYNLTVDNLYKSLMSGADNVTWDPATFRWRYYTIWDYYYSIPEYDAKSGGCFLTFSTKNIQTPSNYPAAADYLAIFISSFVTTSGESDRSGSVYAINRLGTSFSLEPGTIDPSTNVTTARLVPLSNSSFTLRVPKLTGSTPSTIDMSYLQAACVKAFGSFCNSVTLDANSDLTVNPDQLCLIPIEIEDLTNEMITYSRCKGPFVVNYNAKPAIGFLGLE